MLINVLWITFGIVGFLFVLYKDYEFQEYDGPNNCKKFHICVPDWIYTDYRANEANCRYCNKRLKRIKLVGIWIKKKDK